MKYIQLIAFFFCLGVFWPGALCIHAQSKDISVTLRSDYDFSKQEFLAFTKVNVPFVEARGAVTNDSRWNYSVGISTQKLFPKLVFSAKAGNLTATGSLSKLNSPALSGSIGAFSNSSLKLSGLEVSHGQYDSFSAAPGYSFEAGYSPGGIIKQITFDVYYKDKKDDADGSLTTSAKIRIQPAKKTEISFCTTAGLYPYKKKNITSWFTDEAFYKQGNHICFNNQIFVNAGNCSSLFVIGTYETPFGNFINTWRSENLLKFKHFSFTLNGFYNPNDEVITSSDKKINPLMQFSSGVQYNFITETKVPVKITTGLNTFVELNLAQKNHTLKNALGIKYSAMDFAGLLSFNISTKLDNSGEGINTSFENGSIETSNSFYINNFTPKLTTKFTFTPDQNKTKWTFSQRIGLEFEYEMPDQTVTFSNKNQVTFTQKTDDSKNKIAFTCSLNAKFQFRFCILHVHLEFQV